MFVEGYIISLNYLKIIFYLIDSVNKKDNDLIKDYNGLSEFISFSWKKVQVIYAFF